MPPLPPPPETDHEPEPSRGGAEVATKRIKHDPFPQEDERVENAYEASLRETWGSFGIGFLGCSDDDS